MEARAPAFPDHLAERWGMTSALLIADTRSSLVYRVQRDGVSSAIAKLLKPQGLHELPGFDFLCWRNGVSTVRLLEKHGVAALLEDAGSLTLRERRVKHGEEAANCVIADLLQKLGSASPSPHPAALVPLQRHFRALFEQAAKHEGQELSASLRKCAGIAERLLETQVEIRPLHGDLHHDNIISGSERGWLSIDPQGLIGDPAYEVANVFGNPEGFPEIVDPHRIKTLVRLFAPLIGCSEQKILRYAIAHAGLSISWSIEDGRPLSPGSDALERLEFAKIAFRLIEEWPVNS
jgi:streptomycin 6-kinase